MTEEEDAVRAQIETSRNQTEELRTQLYALSRDRDRLRQKIKRMRNRGGGKKVGADTAQTARITGGARKKQYQKEYYLKVIKPKLSKLKQSP